MEKKIERNLVLAIECAVGGGSLSLLENSRELDFVVFQTAQSKAEDLLESISALLKQNQIEKFALRKIVCSVGTGSRTGIRIGKATTEGLKLALSCETAEVSIHEALIVKAEVCGIVQTAHQISSQKIISQIFEKHARNPKKYAKKGLPEEISKEVFIFRCRQFDETILLTHKADFIEEFVGQSFEKKIKIVDISENIARFIGLYALNL